MIITTTTSLPYARRAMNHAKTAWVDIKVAHMTMQHALDWDYTVQREIVRAQRARGPNQPPRADAGWSWVGIRTLLPLALRLRNRRCQPLTILVRNAQGQAVPAGMLLLIEHYPWPLTTDPIRRSTFTWFLASAPKAALLQRGVPDPPSLGRVLIDTALVHSLGSGMGGQMWLHAAAGGGSGLLQFYSHTCQLGRLAAGTRIPGGRSDGRHFYADSALALKLLNALQHYR